MKTQAFVILLPLLFTLSLWSATPVPYSGKIDIQGVNYYGEAQFAFSLHDGDGTTHWRNGKQPGETVKVTIRNGRYTVLLGGQGMTSLAPQLFLNHDKLYLKVEVDMGDGEGLRHLAPDQLISATPRALVAEWAKMAKLAEAVPAGSITREMLSQQVLTQLDANGSSASVGPITRDMLPASVLNDLNKTIVITRDMLPQDVQDDLNKTVTITRNMLPADVLSDLNRTISKSMLANEVLNDLNRTITKVMLAQEILFDLNATIGLDRLSSQAITELNSSGLEDNSVTMAKLESQLRSDLNKTTTRPFGATLSNPYGILGTPVLNDGSDYTVPTGKVLVCLNAKENQSKTIDGKHYSFHGAGDVQASTSIFVPEGKTIVDSNSFHLTGMLYDELSGVTPLFIKESTFQVPLSKILTITSIGIDGGSELKVDNLTIFNMYLSTATIQGGKSVVNTGSDAWTGYLIDPIEF